MKSVKNQGSASLAKFLAAFFICLTVIGWPFFGFVEAMKMVTAIILMSVVFSMGLAFFWWTRGVGIDLGFVKIRGLGWPKESQ